MKHKQTSTVDLRRQRGAKARAEILRAANRLFARHGFEGARMEAIAAAAGVNKALLYYHFKSKNALFRAVMEEHLEEFHRQAVAALSGREPAPVLLLRYLSMHFDFIAARPHYPPLLQRLMMTDAAFASRLARQYFLPRARKFAALIRRGVREGSFRRVSSTQTAISLVGLIVFYFSAASMVRNIARIDPFGGANLRKRKREVLDFVRFGLFCDPGATLS